MGEKEKSQEKAIVYIDMNWQPDIHEMFKPFGSILYSKLAMLWDWELCFPVASSCHEFTGSTDSCLISGALSYFCTVFMHL